MPIELMAHRAGSKTKPNSREAVQAVLDHKPDIIELDVRLSRDFKPVCYHGNLLESMGVYSSTSFYTASELQQQGIPSLPELASLIDGRCDVFLDIKDYRISPSQIFQSFSGHMPSTLHIASRNLDFFKKFESKPEHVKFCRNFGLVPMPSMQKCRDAGVDVVELLPWTFNKRNVTKIQHNDMEFALSPFVGEATHLTRQAVAMGAQWLNVYDVQFYRQLLASIFPHLEGK